MCSGVRSALGPGLRSLSRENSLQGGADQSAPKTPLEATRSRRRYCALSKISNALSASRSNGWKQSACKASMAEVSGALIPANRSKKSFGGCCFGGTGLASSVEYSEEELEEERARFAAELAEASSCWAVRGLGAPCLRMEPLLRLSWRRLPAPAVGMDAVHAALAAMRRLG